MSSGSNTSQLCCDERGIKCDDVATHLEHEGVYFIFKLVPFERRWRCSACFVFLKNPVFFGVSLL